MTIRDKNDGGSIAESDQQRAAAVDAVRKAPAYFVFCIPTEQYERMKDPEKNIIATFDSFYIDDFVLTQDFFQMAAEVIKRDYIQFLHQARQLLEERGEENED